jgi:hypothetical protein
MFEVADPGHPGVAVTAPPMHGDDLFHRDLN